MNEFRSNMYDATGSCPKCHNELTPVTYYQAEKAGRVSDYSKDPISGATVTTVYDSYRNVRPCTAGYCMECAKRTHEQNQQKLATKKPSPVFFIICAVILASTFILSPVISRFYSVPYELGFKDICIIACMILWVINIPVFIVALVVFINKRRTYSKYAGGYRDAFVEPTKEDLSKYAAVALNLKTKGDTTYLDITQRARLILG